MLGRVLVVDVLLPRRCALCGALGPAVCDRCDRALLAVGVPGCRRCGAPGPWPVDRCSECAGRRLAYRAARAAIVYDARARTLVAAWKEGGRRDVSRWAAGRVAESVGRPPADLLVPVPGDRDRTLRRGHVPPRGLARELGRLWDLPVGDCLTRQRPTGRQRGLRAADRRRNVRGLFAAPRPVPARICLVDDVYTTGSTAGSCAAALRRAGAEDVWVTTLARAVR